MRRLRKDSVNLDSLLDLLTNVVGFLVIVLVVLQLNFSAGIDSVRRSSIIERIGDYRSRTEGVVRRTALVMSQIKEYEQETDGSTGSEKPFAQMQAEWQAAERANKRLHETIVQIEAELAGGRERLAQLESQPKHASAEILPNIRVMQTAGTTHGEASPAWLDRERLYIVCHKNRVFHLNTIELNKLWYAEYELAGSEWSKAVRRLRDRRIGNDQAIINLHDNPGMVSYDLRSSYPGSAADDIRHRRGPVVELLQSSTSPEKSWIMCLVWDDSFFEYDTLRDFAESIGYDVGWRPFSGDGRVHFVFGTVDSSVFEGPQR